MKITVIGFVLLAVIMLAAAGKVYSSNREIYVKIAAAKIGEFQQNKKIVVLKIRDGNYGKDYFNRSGLLFQSMDSPPLGTGTYLISVSTLTQTNTDYIGTSKAYYKGALQLRRLGRPNPVGYKGDSWDPASKTYR